MLRGAHASRAPRGAPRRAAPPAGTAGVTPRLWLGWRVDAQKPGHGRRRRPRCRASRARRQPASKRARRAGGRARAAARRPWATDPGQAARLTRFTLACSACVPGRRHLPDRQVRRLAAGLRPERRVHAPGLRRAVEQGARARAGGDCESARRPPARCARNSRALSLSAAQAENKFKCPCHGSQYNDEGKVIRGPAPLVRLLRRRGETGALRCDVALHAWRRR
jgi:hypothetical protein